MLKYEILFFRHWILRLGCDEICWKKFILGRISHQRHIKELFHHQDPWICLIWVGIQVLPNALQETTISHLGKRDIMFEHTLGGDMLGGNLHAYMQFFWTLNISLFGSMRKHANSQKRASHISGIEQCLAAPPSQAPWRRKVRFHLGNNALCVLKFAPWFSKGPGGTAMFFSCFFGGFWLVYYCKWLLVHIWKWLTTPNSSTGQAMDENYWKDTKNPAFFLPWDGKLHCFFNPWDDMLPFFPGKTPSARRNTGAAAKGASLVARRGQETPLCSKCLGSKNSMGVTTLKDGKATNKQGPENHRPWKKTVYFSLTKWYFMGFHVGKCR